MFMFLYAIDPSEVTKHHYYCDDTPSTNPSEMKVFCDYDLTGVTTVCWLTLGI